MARHLCWMLVAFLTVHLTSSAHGQGKMRERVMILAPFILSSRCSLFASVEGLQPLKAFNHEQM
jgi:hypothetical protein